LGETTGKSWHFVFEQFQHQTTTEPRITTSDKNWSLIQLGQLQLFQVEFPEEVNYE